MKNADRRKEIEDRPRTPISHLPSPNSYPHPSSNPMKPRADSPLKTLPEPRQDEIAEYLREHTLKDTRAWLAQVLRDEGKSGEADKLLQEANAKAPR